MSPTRREFLAAAGFALVGLTRKSDRPIAGGFVDDGGAAGHRLRDRARHAAPARTTRVPVVIVGGGIAGLSAAWQLDRRGFRDFVLLEMEREAGGNSRSGANEVSAYPWAAHYVPVPDRGATLVRELFTELGVLRDGVWEERHLCFSPQERHFIHGRWEEGLEPAVGHPGRRHDDLRRFADRIAELRATGEFTIPMARGERASPLDRLSMAAWLEREGLTSPALRWYVDYACRDDYGARAADTSAWAGIHYFASRPAEEEGLLTWSEGNGWIVRRLLAKLGRYVTTDAPVYRVERRGTGLRVLTPDVAYLADAVIFAAPSFVAPYVVEGAGAPSGIEYSPWLTANLTLERWPRERGVGPAWDNVLFDSPALGYVVATHQSLRTHSERTVWTYYWALADGTPAQNRARLQRESWHHWTERILDDLARAHPDIRECVSRVDIMRQAHAMPRPTPGFLESPARRRLARLDGALVHANADLSGFSLFEEAQHRGVAAADAVLRRLGG